MQIYFRIINGFYKSGDSHIHPHRNISDDGGYSILVPISRHLSSLMRSPCADSREHEASPPHSLPMSCGHGSTDWLTTEYCLSGIIIICIILRILRDNWQYCPTMLCPRLFEYIFKIDSRTRGLFRYKDHLYVGASHYRYESVLSFNENSYTGKSGVFILNRPLSNSQVAIKLPLYDYDTRRQYIHGAIVARLSMYTRSRLKVACWRLRDNFYITMVLKMSN